MNVLKNFEALFVVTLGLACATNYVLDTATAAPAQAQTAAVPAYAAGKDVQLVVVSAKRMSAEQKMQSLLDEQKAATASLSSAASKM